MYHFFYLVNNNTMKKILFTGAKSGIAKDTINHLIKNYYIYITVHTKKEEEILIKEYKNINNIKVFKLDVTNQEDKNKIKDLEIDIIVLNAAIGYGGSLLEIPIEKIKENFETNVFSNIEIIQIIIGKMLEKKKGKIIIISSIAGLIPIEFMGSYCATKSSLIMIAKVLKKELKLLESNIKVKLILPGVYKTGFNEIMRDNKKEYIKRFKNKERQINLKEMIIFDLLAKNNLTTIRKEVIKAINDNNNKFIYSAPLSAKIISKLY